MSAVDRMAQGYEPRWDIDKAVGDRGEHYVADIIDLMKAGSHEIKTDEVAASTGNVYLEVMCRYGDQWRASGIADTQAELWSHVIGDVVITARTERVREVAQYCWAQDKFRAACKRGTHPTQGVTIPIGMFVSLVANGIPGA